MAHVGEKGGFRLVGLFRGRQRLRERLVSGHGIAHLLVDDGQSQPDGVNPVVVPVFGVAHAGHPDHLIVFPVSPPDQVAVAQNQVGLQALADGFRIDELQESLPVPLRNGVTGIPGKALRKREMSPLLRLFLVGGVGAVADRLIPVQIHMIDAAVIRGQRRNHLVLLLPGFFLLQQLLLQSQPEPELLLLHPGFRLGGLGPAHHRHIHTQAKGAQPSALVRELDLGCLEMSRIAPRIRYVFDKNMGLIHAEGLLIVFRKMSRGDLIEDVKVRTSPDFFRAALVAVLGKRLIARQINPGPGVFGKHHGGHKGQQGLHLLIFQTDLLHHIVCGHKWLLSSG